MPVYNINDPETDLTLSMEFDVDLNQLSQDQAILIIDREKARLREIAKSRVSSGEYQYGGDVSRTRMPASARQEQLKADLSLSLNIPYDNVNVSKSPLAFIDRSSLSFRANPEQKFNFLKNKFATENNPEPIAAINIGGKSELMLLEELPDGSTRYSLIDEEGFTFDDIGEYAVEVAPTLLSIAAVAIPEPTTSALGLAALSGVTYGVSKYAQDIGTYGLDSLIQEEYDLDEFISYAGRQSLNRTIEGGTAALFDFGFIKGSGYIAGLFGKTNADEIIKQLNGAESRIKNYAKNYDQKMPRVSATSQEGIAREADAVIESGILKNRNKRALNYLNRLFDDIKGGKPTTEVLQDGLERAAREIARQADIAKNNAQKYGYDVQQSIGRAWEEAAERYRIRGSFDANQAGQALQKVLFDREKVLNLSKNKLYKDTADQAKRDNIEYPLTEVINSLRNVFNNARGKGANNTSLFDPELAADITVSFNNILKTNFKTLQDVFDSGVMQRLYEGQPIPNLTYDQLDALLKTINDKAKFGAKSYEKGAHAIMESAANSIRKIRDSKILDKNGNPLNETGRLQALSTKFYNENYLGIYRLLDGKALAKKIGSSKNQTFPELQGNQLLDQLLRNPSQSIEEAFRIIPDQETRDFLLDSMRNRYLQNKGANGSLYVSGQNKIQIKFDEIRELFGARGLNGELLNVKLTDALARSKAEAIDNLNEIAKAFGSDVTSLSAMQINRLLRATSKSTVKNIKDLIEKQIKAQKTADDLLKKTLPQLAADGTLAANPSVYMRNIIALSEPDLKKIIAAIEKNDPTGAIMDNFRVAYIEQIQLLAKKDQIGVSTFDPIILQKNLRRGTREGDNARLILGEEKVKDLEAIARLEEYFSFKEVVTQPAGTVVLGSQGPTGVLGGIQQPILRKLYGLVVVQDMLRPFRTGKKVTPEEYARRMNFLLPLSIATEKGLILSSQELEINPNFSKFFTEELSDIYQLSEGGTTQARSASASPRTGENASSGTQNTPEPPQAPQALEGNQKLTLPQVNENVSQDPLGLAR